jgi:Alpha/beta hydrolase domain
LSWDIYGQVGAALRDGAGLGGLKSERLIAAGESQSAMRLTACSNSIQPLHQVYDGFLTYDRAGPLRTDISVKSISVGTEFSAGLEPPPADSKDHRWWEVAGASHLSTDDLEYMDPVHKRDGVLRDATGNPQTVTQFIGSAGCTSTPLFSRVPTGHVLDMGLEHLIAWIQASLAPITVPRFTRDAAGKVVRDAEGRVGGGVRLPAYDAPIARNSGANSGPGFCLLAGYHLDFPREELCKRYGTSKNYVKQVRETARRAKRERILLPADALKTRAEAARLNFSCGVGG